MYNKVVSVIVSVLKVLGAMSIIPIILALCFLLPGYGNVYETNNVCDYGRIIGNFDNKTPRKFVNSFFPEEIEDCFTDIVYHYKAKKWDGYGYERYLEFTIDDRDVFEKFMEKYVDRDSSVTFIYDNNFQEQSISNVFSLQIPEESKEGYPIGGAQIGKILYSDEQQKFIFVAVGVYDGGGTNTVELGYFFNRFEIDPWQYMQTAYATPYYEELGVPNKEEEGFQIYWSK